MLHKENFMVSKGNLSKRLVLLNRYYRITKFYGFLKETAIKGGSAILIFGLLILGLEIFFLDLNVLMNSLLNKMVEAYPSQVVFLFFLASETVLGIIPPEIFIAWTAKAPSPWLFLFVLASMSYIGGILSYFIGQALFLIPSVKHHIENKIAKHIVNLRKWGGLFVFLGAISPIPHSLVSLASGLIKYNFKYYALWSLFRYARFALYALLIFQVLN